MLLTGIRLENIRVFEGEHVIPISAGLTVLIGRNNAGKSTVLRAPFLFVPKQRHPLLGAFGRQPGKPTSVALQFAPQGDEFQRYFRFRPTDIVGIDIGSARGPLMPLTDSPQFAHWPEQARVELGLLWGEHGPTRTVRLTSRDATDYVEIASNGGHRGRFDGEPRIVKAEVGTFRGALESSLTIEDVPLSGHLLAHWEHHRDAAVSGWIEQSTRRVIDTEEARLQEVLTFLRLKHPSEFERVSRALRDALPEFAGLDFIDVHSSGFSYRPGFVSANAQGTLLAREAIGSGAWTFLCILTAARAAKVTGARVLFLDEPHLYMHPALERLLLDELLDPNHWDGVPLQVITATHSPTFVNAAVERGTLNVLDWDDDARTKVRVRSVVAGDDSARLFDAFGAEAGDMLYAERVVFTEGPSDIAALRILARDLWKIRSALRYVPLRETDAIGSEVARYFSIIVQSHGAGLRTRAMLLLDGDKKIGLDSAWDKLDGPLDPRKTPGLEIVWSTRRGNDLESLFCNEPFLLAYFQNLNIDEATARSEIQAALDKVVESADHRKGKGCTAIRALLAKLLGANDGDPKKAEDLKSLVSFYVTCADQPHAVAVKTALEPIEHALRKLAR